MATDVLKCDLSRGFGSSLVIESRESFRPAVIKVAPNPRRVEAKEHLASCTAQHTSFGQRVNDEDVYVRWQGVVRMPPVQPQMWPAEMDQLAGAHDLGGRVLRDRTKPGKGMIGTTLAFLLLAAVMIIPGVNLSAWFLAALGLLPLILGCLGAFFWIRRNNEEMLWLGLYKRGLVLVSTRQEPVVIRWVDVQTVTIDDRRVSSGFTSSTIHKTTIWTKYSSVVLDDRFEAVDQTARQATASVTAAMVPRVVAALNAGTAIDFGGMTIHRDWIDHYGRRLHWDQVAGIKVKDGRLRIVKHGSPKPWAETVVLLVPNLAVFLTVTKLLRARRHPA